jgi:hypothetical protein
MAESRSAAGGVEGCTTGGAAASSADAAGCWLSLPDKARYCEDQLSSSAGNPRFAFDCRRRFLEGYAETVLGLDPAYLGEKALRPLLGVEQPVPSTNGFMSSRP